jgi:hypothetical protein
MTPPAGNKEAFFRVVIDAQIKDVGWNLADDPVYVDPGLGPVDQCTAPRVPDERRCYPGCHPGWQHFFCQTIDH